MIDVVVRGDTESQFSILLGGVTLLFLMGISHETSILFEDTDAEEDTMSTGMILVEDVENNLFTLLLSANIDTSLLGVTAFVSVAVSVA